MSDILVTKNKEYDCKILERKYFYRRIYIENLVNNQYRCFLTIYNRIAKHFKWSSDNSLNIIIGNNIIRDCKTYNKGGSKHHKSMSIIIPNILIKLHKINENDLLLVELLEDNCTIEISKVKDKDIPDKLELILKIRKSGKTNYGFTIPRDVIDIHNFNKDSVIEVRDIDNFCGYKSNFNINNANSYRLNIRAKLWDYLELKPNDYIKLTIQNNIFTISKYTEL